MKLITNKGEILGKEDISRKLDSESSENRTGSGLTPIFGDSSPGMGIEESTPVKESDPSPEMENAAIKSEKKIPRRTPIKKADENVEKGEDNIPGAIAKLFSGKRPDDVVIKNDGTLVIKGTVDFRPPGPPTQPLPENNDVKKCGEVVEFDILDQFIKGGPYIGPRGGKWADPQHTIPWKDKKEIPTLRYGAEKSKKLLVEMGEFLYDLQSGAHTVKDDAGLNRHDFQAWGDVSGNLDRMRNILRKYKRQLTSRYGDDYYHVGLSDKPKAATIRPEYDPRYGSLQLPIDGRIPKKNFQKYLEIHRGAGAKFSGADRCWFIQGSDLDRFDFDKYRSDLGRIGVDVVEPRGEPKNKKKDAPEPGGESKTKDEKTGDGTVAELDAWEAKRGIADRRIKNTIAVVRYEDGRFAFYSPYSPEFNKLFSNKSGLLSGITKYNPADHGRETHDLELVEEAIDKIKATMPDWKIVTAGVAEARAEKDRYLAELQRPIPEVQKKLNPKFKLFPYQNECVRFLDKTDGNALIGDEMGLGKTLQTLAWAAKNDKKVLVVCPKVVRRTWLQEAAKFFPDHFKGTELIAADLRKKKVPDLSDKNIATVNYESLHKFESVIADAGFDTIVIDESHRMKNPKAKITKMIQAVAADKKHKILLSGTAVKNKREELVTQLDLVAPGKYTKKLNGKRGLKESTIGGLWLKMREDYLARLKSVVLKDLPEKTTTIMSQEVKDLPDISKSPDIGEFAKLKDQVARGKVRATEAVVSEILASSDSRVLVFSDSVQATKDLATAFGDKALLHHGQMGDDAREAVKAEFQKQDDTGNFVSDKRVFVTTRQSMAVGATLTAADKVVFNDLPWTAADLRQAEDRAHRPGQKNAVNIYWVTAENNLFDENVSNILFRKYELSKKVNQGKQLTPEEHEWMSKTLGAKELLDQIRGQRAGPSEQESSEESEAVGDSIHKASVDEFDVLDDYIEKAIYIGPRGGKWLDPKHTIPFRPEKKSEKKQMGLFDQPKKPEKKKILVQDRTGTRPKAEPSEKPKRKRGRPPKKKEEKKIAVEHGEHVWGSRADVWEIRNSSELDRLTLEKQAKFCTKKKLMPIPTNEELIASGASASGIVMRRAVEGLVAAKAPNSLEGRKAYMDGIDFVSRSLDACRTANDVNDLIGEMHGLSRGRRKVATYTEDQYQQMVDEHGTATGNPMALNWEQRKTWEQKLHDVKLAKYKAKFASPEWEQKENEEAALRTEYRSHGRIETSASITEVLAWKLGKDKHDVGVDLKRAHVQSEVGTVYHAMVVDPKLKEHNSYKKMLAALGTRFAKMIDYYGYYGKQPKALNDARARVRKWDKEDTIEEDRIRELGLQSSSKKVEKERRKPFRWERDVPGDIDRIGGEPVTGANTKEMATEFGFKNVQFGHWVDEDEASSHIRGAHGAFRDLADILDMDKKLVSLGGRLSLGIGARGSGKARAHYEPDGQIINITKIAGGGSLAHEWAHAMDNILAKAHNPSSTKANQMISDGDVGGLPEELRQAYSEVMSTIETGDANQWKNKERMRFLKEKHIELQRRRRGGLSWIEREEYRDLVRVTSRKQSDFMKHARAFSGVNGYWSRPHEMFARAFESYVADKLTQLNRRSSYLSSGTQQSYATFRYASDKDAKEGKHAQPYPQGEERATINAAMGKLVAALQRTKALEKAMRYLISLEKVNQDLEKAGPYIGPRGGKWADEKHTIPWKEGKISNKPENIAARRKQVFNAANALVEEITEAKKQGDNKKVEKLKKRMKLLHDQHAKLGKEYGEIRAKREKRSKQRPGDELGDIFSRYLKREELKRKTEKSMGEFNELKEFCGDVEKSQKMSEGGPKKEMGQGSEQGGNLKGKGKTSGSGNSSAGKPIGALAPAKDKLSEDDDEEKKQMKPGKKPLEASISKKSLTPAAQRESVAHETAKKISQLTKSQDIIIDTVGIAPPKEEKPKLEKARVWSQNGSLHFVYSDAADKTAARIAKGEDFYVGGNNPTLGFNPAIVNQQVRCGACGEVMAKSLAACPSCGNGIHRAGGSGTAASGIRLEKKAQGAGLKKAEKKDINIFSVESDEDE